MNVEKELGWEIGVDIGGTFTDIVLRSSSEVLSTKVLTSSEAPVVPVISGIKKLAGDIGISLNDKAASLVPFTKVSIAFL